MWVKIVGMNGIGHLTLFSYAERRVGGCLHQQGCVETTPPDEGSICGDHCSDEVFWVGLNYPSDLIVKMPSQPYALPDDASNAHYFSAGPLSTGGWHHIALVGGFSVLNYYLDGILFSGNSLETSSWLPPENVGSVILGQGHGQNLQNTLHHAFKHYTPGFEYNVFMTEVRLWSVARDASIAVFRDARWRPTSNVSRLLTEQDILCENKRVYVIQRNSSMERRDTGCHRA